MVLFACLRQCLDGTTIRQLAQVSEAILAMSGRVTMRGRARWAGKGGSYRTIQRFFTTSLSWGTIPWVLIRPHRLDQDAMIVLGGDDVVVTKAGKKTHGFERFFSSLYGKPVPGLCFLSFSLISVKRRTSYPVLMEQYGPEYRHAPASGGTKQSTGKRGRPKGSNNQHRREVTLSPYLCVVQEHIRRLLQLIGAHIKGQHLVFDGAFGHNDAVQMIRQLGLHLISKLRHNAALYCPYDGPYAGRGKRKTYGKILDCRNIPPEYVQESCIEEALQTTIYQMPLWHKKCADLLNVVVMVKTNLKTQAVAHVLFCSSDLALTGAQLIERYRLRFPLEVNFRDAKQYWGLEDFMTVNERPVYNSANLAMFMGNVSHALLRPLRTHWLAGSMNDLQAWFRSRQYVVATFTWLPEMPESIFIDHAMAHMAALGRMNHAVNAT
jgi:putative transposase